ncbi:MAG: winged helix-turn-helix domain-containing protein, partial [Gammaproteobacteria bacterium]|nr:winged helix-turn-helix domain-containing protein [candidate division Zixibacteria bacterium]NIR95805.1 winged helix-turn-helix domain-containing protein [Gammaproteobacteria bacterium]NIR66973.1 winged helix-turn-helix domain-containing protein [candidate division Zixibacteria bacterium]NIS48419.1 winged helix-turn-helix domain-containing protein [candidate division Zixibacteria bacterium]NIU16538.1 winged helix-turn-helix domain-containing protein [candidate division Zixibacteria bacterium
MSRPVLARVAKVILDLSESGEVPIDRIKYTNPKMAALAATVPEAISRSIKTFKSDKIIQASRTKISVLVPER